MKKIIFLSLSILAFCLPVFAAQDLKVIPIDHLKGLELKEIMEGAHPEIALELPAHTVLPIRFFLEGDLLHLLKEPSQQIEIKQTFYVRCIQKEELRFSLDLKKWSSCLEFIKGESSVHFQIDDDGKSSINVGATIDHR